MPTLSKAIYRLPAIPVKIPTAFFFPPQKDKNGFSNWKNKMEQTLRDGRAGDMEMSKLSCLPVSQIDTQYDIHGIGINWRLRFWMIFLYRETKEWLDLVQKRIKSSKNKQFFWGVLGKWVGSREFCLIRGNYTVFL